MPPADINRLDFCTSTDGPNGIQPHTSINNTDGRNRFAQSSSGPSTSGAQPVQAAIQDHTGPPFEQLPQPTAAHLDIRSLVPRSIDVGSWRYSSTQLIHQYQYLGNYEHPAPSHALAPPVTSPSNVVPDLIEPHQGAASYPSVQHDSNGGHQSPYANDLSTPYWLNNSNQGNYEVFLSNEAARPGVSIPQNGHPGLLSRVPTPANGRPYFNHPSADIISRTHLSEHFPTNARQPLIRPVNHERDGRVESPQPGPTPVQRPVKSPRNVSQPYIAVQDSLSASKSPDIAAYEKDTSSHNGSSNTGPWRPQSDESQRRRTLLSLGSYDINEDDEGPAILNTLDHELINTPITDTSVYPAPPRKRRRLAEDASPSLFVNPRLLDLRNNITSHSSVVNGNIASPVTTSQDLLYNPRFRYVREGNTWRGSKIRSIPPELTNGIPQDVPEGVLQLIVAPDTPAWKARHPIHHVYRADGTLRASNQSRQLSVLGTRAQGRNLSGRCVATVFPVLESTLFKSRSIDWVPILNCQHNLHSKSPEWPRLPRSERSLLFRTVVLLCAPACYNSLRENIEMCIGFPLAGTLDFINNIRTWTQSYSLFSLGQLYLCGSHFGTTQFEDAVMEKIIDCIREADQVVIKQTINRIDLHLRTSSTTASANAPPSLCNKMWSEECSLTGLAYGVGDQAWKGGAAQKLQFLCALRWRQRMRLREEDRIRQFQERGQQVTEREEEMARDNALARVKASLAAKHVWHERIKDDVLVAFEEAKRAERRGDTSEMPWEDDHASIRGNVVDHPVWARFLFHHPGA